MKLVFQAGTEYIEADISKERVLTLKGRQTGSKGLTLEQLFSKAGGDEMAVKVTNAIIKEVKSLEFIEYYIKYEFARYGLKHVRTEWEESTPSAKTS